MNGQRPMREAMILSGGAAYGAYEVGVMLALFNGDSPVSGGRPLEVDLFAGTSIGSYNAAAMVSRAKLGLAEAARLLRDIWLDEIARPPGGCENGMYRVRMFGPLLNPSCLSRPASYRDVLGDARVFLQEVLPMARRAAEVAQPVSADSVTRAVLEAIDATILLDLAPFHQLLKRTIPLDELEASPLSLSIVATNWDTGELTIFTKEDLANGAGLAAIAASAAVPGFFPVVKIGGDHYVDGGALMNTPLVPGVLGRDILHIVYMDPDVEKIPVESLSSTIGVIDRLLVTAFAFSMELEIENISEVNKSLEFPDTLDPGRRADPRVEAIARTAEAVRGQLASRADFRKTVVHRYHPTDDLGGSLGFLDFSYEHIFGLIDRGYRDAVEHDCGPNGCVIPG